MSNYFNFPNPESLKCHVYEHHSHHSKPLILHVYETFTASKNTFWLAFLHVAYFEGHHIWNGANFCLGNKDELKSLIESWRPIDPASEEEILQHWSLYKVKPVDMNRTIKIIAREARQIDHPTF